MSGNIAIEELRLGLDIYSGQGYPNMPQLVNEGYEFIVSKDTGEGSYVNPYRAKNRENARLANLIWGDYDWVEPQSGMTGAAAAVDYWRTMNAPGPVLSGELVLVDFETPEWYTGPLGRSIEPFMRQYMFSLYDLAQRPIGIYSAPYFWAETGGVAWDWLNDPRFYYWMAAPGPNAEMPDTSFWPSWAGSPFKKVVLHQHSWHATSSAVQMEFDKNRFWGTRDELLKYGGATLTSPAVGGDDVQLPPEGKVAWAITPEGVPYFIWNPGGRTRNIRSVDIQNIGMVVESFTEPGKFLTTSIFNGVPTGYNPLDDGGHKVFLPPSRSGAPHDKDHKPSRGDNFRSERTPPSEYVADPEQKKSVH